MTNENSFEQIENQRPVIYALIWKANAIGTQSMKDFEDRIPRLMAWHSNERNWQNRSDDLGCIYCGPSTQLSMASCKVVDHKPLLKFTNPDPDLFESETICLKFYSASSGKYVDSP